MGYQKWSDADLSAYLDGQLSPDQARALESALQDNQELKARLDGLLAVVGMVRELPAYEAPRNYILTPSMVETNPKQSVRRYRAPLFMRVATSLTAAAFIVTMGLNVFLNSPVSAPFAMMSAPQEEAYAEPEMMMLAEEPAAADAQAPRAMEMEKEEPVEKAVVAVEKTVEVETIEETEDGVGESGELPEEMGIGGGGEGDLGAATVLPEDGEGQVVEESIAEETAEADAVNTVEMEETAVDDDANVDDVPVEATAMPLPTATQQVMEEVPPSLPEEQPMPPVWDGDAPQSRFPQWLPWTLGGCALVLGIVTWFMGRRRR